MAAAVADNMEAIAKGITTADKALGAIKATAKAFVPNENIPTIQEYLTTYKAGKAESTQRNFNRAAKELTDYLGAHALKEIDWLTEAKCREFLRSLQNIKEHGTVRTYKSYLHAAFEKAKKAGYIEVNPFGNIEIERSKTEKFKRQTFTSEEMQRLLTEPAYPWKEAVTISYYTGGQRLGDICNLQWKQIDFTTETIQLTTGKTGREMSIPIIAPLLCVLKELQQRNGSNRYVLPELQIKYTRSKGGASVEFTAMLTAMGIGKRVKSSKSGRMQNVKSFHSIRHTTVTALRESELVSKDVAHEIVGQSSEMVQRAYSHPSRKKKEEALHLLEKNLNEKEDADKEATDKFLQALQNSADPESMLRELLNRLKKA